MVSKLDKQTFTSELVSHCMFHSFSLVPHRSKELRKLLRFDISSLLLISHLLIKKFSYNSA